MKNIISIIISIIKEKNYDILEEVEAYVYLSQKLRIQNEKAHNYRKKVSRKHGRIMKSTLPTRQKCKIYNHCVLVIMNKEYEIWKIIKSIKNNLRK